MDDFTDMVSDVLVATPGYLNGYGEFVASGQVLTLPCRYESKAVLVRDQAGHLMSRDQSSREITSTLHAIVLAYSELRVDTYRYTIPSRFDPNTSLQAISIDKEDDEDGECYEIVFFP